MDRNAKVTQPRSKFAAPLTMSHKWRQNEAYRDGFNKLLWISNIQLVIILALVIGFGVYVKTFPVKDNYFAETAEGRRMPLVALPLPNMGRTALSQWVSQAVTEIMTFGFNDINQRFSMSQRLFSPSGWVSFRDAMIRSGIINDVSSLQQIITSVPQSEPVLISEGLIRGKYRWIYEMKLRITIRSGAARSVTTKTVRVSLERVPTNNNPAAIGIGEWYIY